MSAQDVIEQSELKLVHRRPVTVDQILGTLEMVSTGVMLEVYGVQTPTEHLADCLASLKAQAATVATPVPAPAQVPQAARPASPLEKREIVFASALETLQKQVSDLWHRPVLSQ